MYRVSLVVALTSSSPGYSAMIRFSFLLLSACSFSDPTPVSEPGTHLVSVVEDPQPILTPQVDLGLTNNNRADFAEQFERLALMADAQHKAEDALIFRRYAALLRDSFVSVEISTPDDVGQMQVINPPDSNAPRFTMYDGNYTAMSGRVESYEHTPGDTPNLLMIDSLMRQEILGTAVTAHGLNHHEVLSTLTVDAVVTETEVEMTAWDMSRRVLDVASNGAYSAYIVAVAKQIPVPTPADGFVTAAPTQEGFSALFPNESGDRRRNYLFDQFSWDVNTELDRRSTKSGEAREERHRQLYARRQAMLQTDAALTYLRASYVADE